MGHQPLQDGPLDPEIDRHDMERAFGAGLQPRIEGRGARLGPGVGLLGAHLGRQVESGHGGGGTHLLQKLLGGGAITAAGPIHGSTVAEMAHQGPGIDPGNAHNAMAIQPLLQIPFRAPVARSGD